MERPTLVTAIAILFFMFGGLGLACYGSVVLTQVTRIDEVVFQMMPGPVGAEYVEQKERTNQRMEDNVPLYAVVNPVQTVLALLLCVLMIVTGIGLWQMRPWGRALSLIYAPVSLLSTCLGSIYNIAFIVPVNNEMFEDMGNPQMAQMQSIMGAGSVAFAGLLGSIFPLFVLICMLLPSMSAAFRAPRPAVADSDDQT